MKETEVGKGPASGGRGVDHGLQVVWEGEGGWLLVLDGGDSIAIGYFHALKGILTSIGACNKGPQLNNVSNFAPWSLSVAATTIDRNFVTKVQLITIKLMR